MIAPLALSTLEPSVGSFVKPNVTFTLTYSVVLFAGAAVMLSKKTGTAGLNAPKAVN